MNFLIPNGINNDIGFLKVKAENLVKAFPNDNICVRCFNEVRESLKIKGKNVCFHCIEINDIKLDGYWFHVIFYKDKYGNTKRRY